MVYTVMNISGIEDLFFHADTHSTYLRKIQMIQRLKSLVPELLALRSHMQGNVDFSVGSLAACDWNY